MIVRRIGHFDEAEDIAQQAFFEAARTLDQFRGESELSTWLYGIAMNLIRNYLNRAPYKTCRFEPEHVLDSRPSNHGDPESALELRQLLAEVTSAMDQLPAEMREVLLLVGVHQLSYEAAASRLDVPIGTVRSRLSRARAALKLKLGATRMPPASATATEHADASLSAPERYRGGREKDFRPTY
ncbi:hypothetical protein VARIO8X_90182 [Burkholderiales bacterium 8X]|nr:hypothetical protein VARIO8X_90182 [Burkholderiales bacterium 8X]